MTEMSVRRDVPADVRLTARQRATLFYETKHADCTLPDAEITFAAIVHAGCSALQITAAEIGPLELKRRGATTPMQLRRLGFDALHLTDETFVHEIVAAFGAQEVSKSFLLTAEDAVAVAGSPAVEVLNTTTNDLLVLCAGAPMEAHAVLQQTTRADALEGVSTSTLLDTGLRAAQLHALGYSSTGLARTLEGATREIAKFGFKL
jgi:hypothetical protein